MPHLLGGDFSITSEAIGHLHEGGLANPVTSPLGPHTGKIAVPIAAIESYCDDGVFSHRDALLFGVGAVAGAAALALIGLRWQPEYLAPQWPVRGAQ